MALNRDKFRKIVGGITTAEPEADAAEPPPPAAEPVTEAKRAPAGQGRDPAGEVVTGNSRRFAKRGRPKNRKEDEPASRGPKVKVSLFLSEVLVNDLYDWAHQDRIHPGEMFERALKPFHEREAKRRNGGKE